MSTQYSGKYSGKYSSHINQDNSDSGAASSADDTGLSYQQVTPVDAAAIGSVAPHITASAITDVLYMTEPGDASAISISDIHQGALGDCFLLSSIGEIALFHPSAITAMIHANGSGSETVTLYKASNGSLPTFGTTNYHAVTETVSNGTFSSLGVNSSHAFSQDIVGSQQEIWPQVLEDAGAMLNGGYNAIANGGYPVIAMEELTGMAATNTTPGQMTLNNLLSDIQQGDLLVFDTRNSNSLSNGLVGDHAYMLKSCSAGGAVQLANPWGTDQPSAVAFSQLARAGISEIDIGHVHS